MQRPLVTIAMPCRDEERFIERCLRSVSHQDYPADRIEILVADGMSRDATRRILARLAAVEPRLRVIDNPGRIQAAGMNAVIRASRGDVIVRMDVHCEYAPSYVRSCVEELERTGADNVGGAQRSRATTPFQHALCAALSSPLGVGGAKYRSPDREGLVDTVFLGAFPRSTFERFGMYDAAADINEDAELNQRVVTGGGKVYLSRQIVVHYHPRESFMALSRQYFRYGKGRARTLVKHRKLLGVRPLVPFFAVATALALVVTSPWHPLAPLAFAAYGIVTAVEAARVGRAARIGSAGWAKVWAIFPVLHAAHGLGFAVGLARYGWATPRSFACELDEEGRRDDHATR
jgi:glycosyltransferase involved in cell wall biosynthesis